MFQGRRGAGVLETDQHPEQTSAVVFAADLQGQAHVAVVLGRGDAVDAGDRGYHNHVAPLKEGAGGGVAQLLDLGVDVGFFLDVGVTARDVGLGLVVVVVADEILDGVFREEFLELGGQLGGQSLVMGEHQRRALDALDHVGDGEGLAGAGYAEQSLRTVAVLDALKELIDGAGLTAGRLKVGADLESRAGAALWKGGHGP